MTVTVRCAHFYIIDFFDSFWVFYGFVIIIFIIVGFFWVYLTDLWGLVVIDKIFSHKNVL